MEFAFRLRQAVEDRARLRLNAFGEAAPLDQRFDLRQVPMAALGGYLDFQARAYQSSAHRAGPLEFVEPEGDFFQFREQLLGGNAGVDEGAEKHVAADSGRAVEVCSFHISLGRISPDFP